MHLANDHAFGCLCRGLNLKCPPIGSPFEHLGRCCSGIKTFRREGLGAGLSDYTPAAKLYLVVGWHTNGLCLCSQHYGGSDPARPSPL